MDIALRDGWCPKLLRRDIEILSPEYEHWYLLFMRSVKKAKEMLCSCNSVCICTHFAGTNCWQAAVIVAGQAGGKAVYWIYQLKKDDLVLAVAPVVKKMVSGLRTGLTDVCNPAICR